MFLSQSRSPGLIPRDRCLHQEPSCKEIGRNSGQQPDPRTTSNAVVQPHYGSSRLVQYHSTTWYICTACGIPCSCWLRIPFQWICVFCESFFVAWDKDGDILLTWAFEFSKCHQLRTCILQAKRRLSKRPYGSVKVRSLIDDETVGKWDGMNTLFGISSILTQIIRNLVFYPSNQVLRYRILRSMIMICFLFPNIRESASQSSPFYCLSRISTSNVVVPRILTDFKNLQIEMSIFGFIRVFIAEPSL